MTIVIILLVAGFLCLFLAWACQRQAARIRARVMGRPLDIAVTPDDQATPNMPISRVPGYEWRPDPQHRGWNMLVPIHAQPIRDADRADPEAAV